MANPLEKQFLIIHNIHNEGTTKMLMEFIEKKLAKNDLKDSRKYLHWLRTFGGGLYLIGTCENTYWTPDKIVDKIRDGVPGISNLLVVEIQGRNCQGIMSNTFWKTYNTIQDLTSFIRNNNRASKLKKIKVLLDKKEQLKQKEIELKSREEEIIKRKEMLSEEEILLEKEEEIKRQEAELLKKEKEIQKRKKFLGIF